MEVPTGGFILKKWEQTGYRATAHSYLKRENLIEVENRNGRRYNLSQLENSMINFHK